MCAPCVHTVYSEVGRDDLLNQQSYHPGYMGTALAHELRVR